MAQQGFSFDGLINNFQANRETERERPSPLKNAPELKKPKNTQSLTKVTRSLSVAIDTSNAASDTTVASTSRAFGLVPMQNFDTDKLPTNREVLGRMFYFRDLSNNRKEQSIAEEVFSEIEIIYNKALGQWFSN